MALNLDLPKAGVAAVDEVSKTIVPELEPILQGVVDKLIAGFKGILVGRTITITIK